MPTIDKFRWKKDKNGYTVMYIDESGMKKRKEKSDQNAVAELTREGLYKENKWLWEENKKLKEINESQNEEIQRFKDNAMQDMREITDLEIENRKLKETIKDHQLYEEKLEHRIIEFEELLHGE